MTFRVTRKRILFALAVLLVAFGSFASGFIACLHEKRVETNDLRKQYLRAAGDAPPEVRSGVLSALRALQEGYTAQDPGYFDSQMSRYFDKSGDVLIMGTDGAEWVRGYPAAVQFIRADWERWGDVQFAIDNAIISSSGDVAWVASVGDVHFEHGDRPMRFSAVLKRSGNNWIFRQIQFQWDDRDPIASDAFRLRTHLGLVRYVFRGIVQRFRGPRAVTGAVTP